MMDQVLEMVAYVALGLGVALLSYRHLAPAIARTLSIVRFRRRLRRFDDVLATWAAVQRAEIVDPRADEPAPPENLARRRSSGSARRPRQDPGPTGATGA